MHDAVFDLVELIKTYQSKNKLSKVLMSTLFKQRQMELEAVIDRVVVRLQVRVVLPFRVWGVCVELRRPADARPLLLSFFLVWASAECGCLAEKSIYLSSVYSTCEISFLSLSR